MSNRFSQEISDDFDKIIETTKEAHRQFLKGDIDAVCFDLSFINKIATEIVNTLQHAE